MIKQHGICYLSYSNNFFIASYAPPTYLFNKLNEDIILKFICLFNYS